MPYLAIICSEKFSLNCGFELGPTFLRTPLCYETALALSAKLHYTDTDYGHHQRTPPTDELTTVLQLVVQQIHHQQTKICHIPTS